MNIRAITYPTLAVFALTSTVSAATNELNRKELRALSAEMNLPEFSEILAKLESRFDGAMLDVRAFESDGIYYRVLWKLPNGKLAAIVLNAESGEVMPKDSAVTKSVMAVANSNKSKGKSASAKGAGNSNAGGNGNGNAGNGNGNNGGNGNSGGNGKGKNK